MDRFRGRFGSRRNPPDPSICAGEGIRSASRSANALAHDDGGVRAQGEMSKALRGLAHDA